MLLIVTVIGLVVFVFLFPLSSSLEHVQDWAIEKPRLAIWLVGLTFVFAALLLLPVAPVVMLAGLMFGLLKGLLLIWVAGFVSSTLAFWCGRTIARPVVERRVRHHNTLAMLDRAITNNGTAVVLLARLSVVIPFGPLNYSLSLTGLKFRNFVLATNIGMIPSYFLSIYLGTTAGNISQILNQELKLTGGEWAVGLATTAFVFIGFSMIVRLALLRLRMEAAHNNEGECEPDQGLGR